MWVWLATLVVVGVGANDVFAPETTEAGEGGTTHLVEAQHHKVHNLVLNPEQHSLCELKHIRQIITHAHCVSKEIENHVCVGTCFSYSVPQTNPETPGDELLDYCDSCQASESHWTTLMLDCEEYGSAYQEKKMIQMITNCSCSPCHPPKGQPPAITNEVTIHNTESHHVSELIYKMLPDTHKFKEGTATPSAAPAAATPAPVADPVPATAPAAVPAAASAASAAATSAIALREENAITRDGELMYTKMSLGDLKKEFNLDPHQETLLKGRVLFRHSPSFDDEEEDPRHLNY